jgi:hypothetical protein
MRNEIAPIVLFTYKRLEALQKTVDALAANFLAAESDLIIYSDGAKNLADQRIIEEIRGYLKTITGFKSVSIHASHTNKGLATSIIKGVSDVMNQYHKAIVLEDDLIASTNFLSFMNQALDKYKLNKKVCSISGYAFDFTNINSKEDGYFLNRSWSWGWASWEDRWTEIDWDVKDYPLFKKDSSQKKGFSKLGSDVYGMLSKQMDGEVDSWYIRSTYHQFKVKGLTLYPSISKIDNNGFDSIATHTSGLKNRYLTPFDKSGVTNFSFPESIQIDKKIQLAFEKKMSIKTRLINKIKELFLK